VEKWKDGTEEKDEQMMCTVIMEIEVTSRKMLDEEEEEEDGGREHKEMEMAVDDFKEVTTLVEYERGFKKKMTMRKKKRVRHLERQETGDH